MRDEKKLAPFEDRAVDARAMLCVIELGWRVAEQRRQLANSRCLIPVNESTQDARSTTNRIDDARPPGAIALQRLEEKLVSTFQQPILLQKPLFERLDEIFEPVGIVVQLLVADPVTG